MVRKSEIFNFCPEAPKTYLQIKRLWQYFAVPTKPSSGDILLNATPVKWKRLHLTCIWPTSSMTLTQVGESPHITEPNTKPHTRQDVLGFVVPLGPVVSLLLFHPLQICIAWDPQIQSWVRKNQPHGIHMWPDEEEDWSPWRLKRLWQFVVYDYECPLHCGSKFMIYFICCSLQIRQCIRCTIAFV